MLEFLRGKASDRKLRLVACACCRRVLPLLPDLACWIALAAAEDYADGALELRAYLRAAHAFDSIRRARFPKTPTPDDGAWNAVYCTVHRRWETEHDAYFAQQRWKLAAGAARDAAHSAGADEASVQAALVRDIIGNPFRPAALDPAPLAWSDACVPKLAQAIYEERIPSSGNLDPARLAILADALEEAGCNEQSLLDHLRDPQPHALGCWVVDLVLAKG
jgi:hypothetical protein